MVEDDRWIDWGNGSGVRRWKNSIISCIKFSVEHFGHHVKILINFRKFSYFDSLIHLFDSLIHLFWFKRSLQFGLLFQEKWPEVYILDFSPYKRGLLVSKNLAWPYIGIRFFFSPYTGSVFLAPLPVSPYILGLYCLIHLYIQVLTIGTEYIAWITSIKRKQIHSWLQMLLVGGWKLLGSSRGSLLGCYVFPHFVLLGC